MIKATTFAGQKVAVFGMARSGVAAGVALRAGGAAVLAADDSEAGRERAREAGFEPQDLRDIDWSSLAALVLAPGVPLTHPEPHWTVKMARAAGVEVIGDTELFVREIAGQGSGAKVVAITGTNGKSTTTALTAHVLGAAGRKVSVGGNIGAPVLALEPLEDERIYVIEFSSYQIDLTPSLAPDAGALLNLAPDHLDRHGTLENYAAVKARMFARQGPDTVSVVGVDDDLSRDIAKSVAQERVRRVSVLCGPNMGEIAGNGTCVADGELVRVAAGGETERISLDGILSLRGAHNGQNAAVAWELAAALGLTSAEVAAGLRTFPGLAHRMQAFARNGKVVFVNDSKATNADAAGHALAAFDEIFWIAGGRAKEGGIAGLQDRLGAVRKVYLVGEAAQMLAGQLPGNLPAIIAGTVESAARMAFHDASASDGAEPVVLLSPACASFDQFPDFEARGRAFEAAVMALSGTAPLHTAPRGEELSQEGKS